MISTMAVRDTLSMPGGGTIETIRGGAESRMTKGNALSLPCGPTRAPLSSANAWYVASEASREKLPVGRASKRYVPSCPVTMT